MFRDKYVYTNPDVVHLMERAKKRRKLSIINSLVSVALVTAVGAVMTKRADAQLAKEMENIPND